MKKKSTNHHIDVLTDKIIEETAEMIEINIKELGKKLIGNSQVKKNFTFIRNPVFGTHWLYEKFLSDNN